MGRRGPPPTPTALRVLHGETRPSRINAREPMPLQGTPRPPRWLCREARQHWRDLVKQLEPMGVLTLADQTMLAMLADSIADLVAAQKAIVDGGGVVVEGANGRVKNAALTPKWRARADVMRLAVQFGLTPAARVSLTARPSEDTTGVGALLS